MSTEMMIVEFTKAAGMVLAISYLVAWSYHSLSKHPRYRDLTVGFVIGLAALISMSFPFEVSPGLFFDARTLVLSVGAAVGGPLVAGIAWAMSVVYRLYLGGVGAPTGMLTISFASGFGLFFWYLVNRRGVKATLPRILLMGLVVHFFNLLVFLTLPVAPLEFFLTISVPMLIVFPLISVIMYRMLHGDLMLRESEDKVVQALSERDKALLQQSDSLVQVIQAISLTIEKRDPYTAGHQQNVARLAEQIARKLGWSEVKIKGLVLGASIHDLGKIYIPAEILNRPGKLTHHEFGMIQSHSEVGFDILKDIAFPWPVGEMVLQHHERLDGSGYPLGLKGDQIIPEARVICVADVVEAIASHRPYRPALGMHDSIQELKRGRGKIYDSQIVDTCISIIESKDFSFDKLQGYKHPDMSKPTAADHVVIGNAV